MNIEPNLSPVQAIVIAIFAALATSIAIGIVAAVTGLFQSRGMPFEEVVAAERACASRTYVSERQNCVREWLAASKSQSVVRK